MAAGAVASYCWRAGVRAGHNLGVGGLCTAGRALRTGGITLLLLLEVLPWPFRPLRWLVGRPRHQRWRSASPAGTVVSDLWLPGFPHRGRRPALIFAMGVRTAPHDQPIIRGFARTLARLGFVVLWPRLHALDRGYPGTEEPATFVTAFETLAAHPAVDPQRIAFLGFSVGGSVALVAASDPRIADRLRAVVFFGGYYDVFDFLSAAASGVSVAGGRCERWRPSVGAMTHLLSVVAALRVPELLRAFPSRSPAEARAVLATLPPTARTRLERLNPAPVLDRVRARIFILHDRRDEMVHYFESEKLFQALGPQPNAELAIVDLFEHVQPRQALSWRSLRELAQLARFVFRTLAYLEGTATGSARR